MTLVKIRTKDVLNNNFPEISNEKVNMEMGDDLIQGLIKKHTIFLNFLTKFLFNLLCLPNPLSKYWYYTLVLTQFPVSRNNVGTLQVSSCSRSTVSFTFHLLLENEIASRLTTGYNSVSFQTTILNIAPLNSDFISKFASTKVADRTRVHLTQSFDKCKLTLELPINWHVRY